MKAFYIVPLIDSRIAPNQAGDKKLKDLLKNQFDQKRVLVLPRSKSRRSDIELYSHKIIFLDDEDANFLQLLADRKEFYILEIKNTILY